MADPDGAFARAATHSGSPLKPWRAARDYANAYQADLSDVVDYGCHLQLHLDPTTQHRFESALDAATTAEVDPADLAADAPPDLVQTLTRLAALGRQVIGVDVTADDVRAVGLHVTRVLVAGYYSNTAAGLPFPRRHPNRHPTRLHSGRAAAPDPPAPFDRTQPTHATRPRPTRRRSAGRARVCGGSRTREGAYFPVAWARACLRAVSWATCQSWKDAPAGVMVSVIVVTGIPAVLAWLTWACTSGVAFWLLYT